MSIDQHGYFDSLSVLIRVYVVNHPYLDNITLWAYSTALRMERSSRFAAYAASFQAEDICYICGECFALGFQNSDRKNLCGQVFSEEHHYKELGTVAIG